MQHQTINPYSNVTSQLEIDLEEERQALLEDQKTYRRRAQKLSTETNRRRKALQEKHREEAEKEQRFREEILQQRKLKLQEATEKFQRAHLPPSQRKRTVYVHKKTTPKLEDALEQIQGSPLYYTYNHTSPFSNRTTDTNSALVTVEKDTWNRKQQVTPKLGFERMFQDTNFAQFNSNQFYFQHKLAEAQRMLEEHHLSNLQSFHQEVEQLEHSESLSSLDSLDEDTGNIKEQNKTPDEFTSTNLHRALSAISPFSASNTNIVSSVIHQYGDENNSDLNKSNSSEITADKIAADKHLENKDQMVLHSGMMAEQALANTFTHNNTTHCENKQSSSTRDEEPISKMTINEHRTAVSEYRDTTMSNLGVKPSRAWATPDPTPREVVQNFVPQENKETTHQGIYIKSTVSQPVATPILLPTNEWNGSASNCHDEVHPNSMKSRYLGDHSVISIAGTDIFTSASNAQLHIRKNENTDYGEPINSDLGLNGNTFAMYRKYVGDPGYVTQNSKELNKTAEKGGTMLLKGILKKDSKYENGYSRIGMSKTLHFGVKSRPLLRDSVELTKEKEQLPGNQKTANKKLRWLDEIDKVMTQNNITGLNKYGTSVPSSEHPDTIKNECALAPNSTIADQTQSSNGSQSSVFSTGYHFTKQAWVPSKGEESVEYNPNSRITPKAKTKLVRRPKSAKNQSTLSPKNRKGTIIRPQSANEMSRILKSQGKLLTPHPPPRPVTGIVNTQNVANGMNQLDYGISNRLLTNHAITKDTMRDVVSAQLSAHSSGNLITNPTEFESAMKSASTLNNDRPLVLQESFQTSSKRYPVYGENGLRLDHTPTDEEIALLWHGVRSALTHKHGVAGDFHSGDLPSNIQATRPNLSHVIIDGGNLLNLKSLSRVNGLLSPSCNGYSTIARRKQILESTENKRKALLEQRRFTQSSAGWRAQHTQNLHSMKISPFPSALEPGKASHNVPNPNEVSESTAQFILAENLVETSATDGEILAAMQAIQANKQSFLMRKAQHIGLGALSLEEQRILQSIDRLNQRLHNVQEAIIKNPSLANGFTVKSPLNIQQISQPADTSLQSQKIRSLSADPRTRLQRRY